MSHVITLSDETFAMLQSLARPFVDTPESVISGMAEAEVGRRKAGSHGAMNGKGASGEVLRLDPDAHENLTHARLLAASVGGRPLHKPKWNGLMDHLHVLAFNQLGSFDALRRASSANVRKGRFEENGYRFLPQVDVSIQGVDANLAWDHSLGVARALEMSIEVRFEWRDKEGAAHPGKEAILEWAPVQSEVVVP